jgi:hypothetical protein
VGEVASLRAISTSRITISPDDAAVAAAMAAEPPGLAPSLLDEAPCLRCLLGTGGLLEAGRSAPLVSLLQLLRLSERLLRSPLEHSAG